MLALNNSAIHIASYSMVPGHYLLLFVTTLESVNFSLALSNQSDPFIDVRYTSLRGASYFESRYDVNYPGNYSLVIFNSTLAKVSFRHCHFSQDSTDHSDAISNIYGFLVYLNLAFAVLVIINVLHFPSSFLPLHFFFLLYMVVIVFSNYLCQKLWAGFAEFAVWRSVSESFCLMIGFIGIGLIGHGWYVFRMRLPVRYWLKIVLPAIAQGVFYFVGETAGKNFIVLVSLVINLLLFVLFVQNTAAGIDSLVDRLKKIDDEEVQLEAKLALAFKFTRLVLLTLVAAGVFFFMFKFTHAPPLALAILSAVNEVVTGIGSLEYFCARKDGAGQTVLRPRCRHVGRLVEPNRRRLVMLSRRLPRREPDTLVLKM
jgi:hypothetical protein